MTDDPRKLDPIEQALLELEAAQHDRVFVPTRVDAVSRVPGQVERKPIEARRHALRWISAAAAVALAFGVWSWTSPMGVGTFDRGDAASGVAQPAAGRVESSGCDGSFLRCFMGPSQRVASSCLTHDYDADGDVDLADYRVFLLDCDGPAHLR